MTKSQKLTLCKGCDNDFYNDNNAIGVKECWFLRTTTPVDRWRVDWWTQQDQPGAFIQVRVLDCRSERGKYAFYKELPDCARDPVRRSR